jgi:hypothetical protein
MELVLVHLFLWKYCFVGDILVGKEFLEPPLPLFDHGLRGVVEITVR